jgi:hypothetical protein
MAHIPVNHRLRSFYRALGALVGLYVLVFGIVGIIQSAGTGLFERADITALGLRTNMAFSILSIVSGMVILAGVVIGRNLDQQINYYGGILFLIVPTVMMTLLRTDGNILNFSMSTVIVSYIIGMILFSSGLYIKIGTEEDERHAESYRYIQH